MPACSSAKGRCCSYTFFRLVARRPPPLPPPLSAAADVPGPAIRVLFCGESQPIPDTHALPQTHTSCITHAPLLHTYTAITQTLNTHVTHAHAPSPSSSISALATRSISSGWAAARSFAYAASPNASTPSEAARARDAASLVSRRTRADGTRPLYLWSGRWVSVGSVGFGTLLVCVAVEVLCC